MLTSIVAASLIATPVEGYDSEAIRDKARSNGMIPIIPKRANAKKTNPYFDRYLYKLRHLVENMCNGQVKSDTGIEITVFFCSKIFGDKYPNFECNRT